MKELIEKWLFKFIGYLEIVIAIVVLIGVIFDLPELIGYLKSILFEDRTTDYALFMEFLEHVLLCIIGIELSIMIITRSYESVVTLVLFVISKKMVIKAHTMTELLIGTISFAIAFLILTYILNDHHLMAKFDKSYKASISLTKLKRDYGISINSDKIIHTLGSYIYYLAEINGVKHISKGMVFEDENYVYTIVSMSDGVLSRIKIEDIYKNGY
ncbi:MAG: hypothetical protein SOZ89_03155 [Peptoniphilaceae bacterium]|nr:hypothetical protein [Peptoniphilaceae bacterium]MDD7383776.1 hypothetical protein [Peptoniphilaceae bacterium]MDY3738104.1 hypothetical protein [Peptoniphilaceae bacterium]